MDTYKIIFSKIDISPCSNSPIKICCSTFKNGTRPLYYYYKKRKRKKEKKYKKKKQRV